MGRGDAVEPDAGAPLRAIDFSGRVSREPAGGLVIDGSRGGDRQLEGLTAYTPTVNPMEVIVATERTEIAVDWSDKPLFAEEGDLIMVSENGERHPLKKDLFEQTYSYLPDGRATKSAATMAKQMSEPFTVHTLEGEAAGQAGDWLAQGAAGECWPIPDQSFRKRYQL